MRGAEESLQQKAEVSLLETCTFKQRHCDVDECMKEKYALIRDTCAVRQGCDLGLGADLRLPVDVREWGNKELDFRILLRGRQ